MIYTYKQFINENQVNPYLPYLDLIEDDEVKQYLKNNDPAANNNLAIRFASENGLTQLVKVLLQDSRVDPSADDNYAIQLASQNGHLEVVKVLLQDPRVDPSDDDNYAIRWASEYGHLEVVKLLLQDPRVDPSDDDNYAIQFASKNGHLEVIRLLLQDPRVDPTADDNFAIRWASEYGKLEVAKLLADHLCGGECLLSIDEIKEIHYDTKDSEIHNVIARKNQNKIAKQQGFGDEDDLLDLF